MTLLGKILTVLIFVMSVLFMAFSISVYATHTNWKAKVAELSGDVESWRSKNNTLQVELERSKAALAREQAARRAVIATLWTRADSSKKELDAKIKEFQDLQATHSTLQVQTRMVSERLGMLTTEVADLRGDIRKTIDDRNTAFANAVTLTDQIVAMRGTHDTLKSRYDTLLVDLTRAKGHLESLGVRLNNPLPDEPPSIRGIVTSVNDRDLVEISLGEDDGIRAGHELYVFRNRTYVARVVVRRVSVDFAVAEVLKDYSKTTIQKGDEVATKLTT